MVDDQREYIKEKFLSVELEKAYNIGRIKSCIKLHLGYDDCNYKVVTTKGRLMCKVFASTKSARYGALYAKIANDSQLLGFRHPQIIKPKKGIITSIKVNSSVRRAILMTFVSDPSLYEIGEIPTRRTLSMIVDQALKLHQLKIQRFRNYDPWAVVNFYKEFQKKQAFLTLDDRKYMSTLAERIKRVDLYRLPHFFIHGDLVKTNILLKKDGTPTIIDFSAAGYYPRVQELAVLASNVFFDDRNPSSFITNISLLTHEFQRKSSLEMQEIFHLPLFIAIAHCINYMSANYQKLYLKNDTKENNYWLNLGKKGIELSIKSFPFL